MNDLTLLAACDCGDDCDCGGGCGCSSLRGARPAGPAILPT